jgi:hypothetical protein
MNPKLSQICRVGSALVCLSVLSGCGPSTTQSRLESGATAVSGATGTSGSGTSGSGTTTTTAALPVGSAALASTIDLSDGSIVLSPTSPSAIPVTPAAVALNTVESSDMYFPQLGTLPSSGLKYALLTDSSFGPQPTNGGQFKPTYVNHPVWFVEYQNVPYEPSGPTPSTTIASAATTSTSPPTTDQWLILDDATDTAIMTLLGLPGLNT